MKLITYNSKGLGIVGLHIPWAYWVGSIAGASLLRTGGKGAHIDVAPGALSAGGAVLGIIAAYAYLNG